MLDIENEDWSSASKGSAQYTDADVIVPVSESAKEKEERAKLEEEERTRLAQEILRQEEVQATNWRNKIVRVAFYSYRCVTQTLAPVTDLFCLK